MKRIKAVLKDANPEDVEFKIRELTRELEQLKDNAKQSINKDNKKIEEIINNFTLETPVKELLGNLGCCIIDKNLHTSTLETIETVENLLKNEVNKPSSK